MLSFINCDVCDTISEIKPKDVIYIYWSNNKYKGFYHKFKCPHCGSSIWIDDRLSAKHCFIDFEMIPPPQFSGINYGFVYNDKNEIGGYSD